MTWITALTAWILLGGPDPGVTLVMTLEAKGGLSTDTADQVAAMLGTELRRHISGKLVTIRDVERVLTQEQARQALDCLSESCAMEVAGAMNARWLILGSVGRVGTSYAISLSRVDARDGRSVASETEVVESGDEADLLKRVPDMVRHLYDAPATAGERAPASARQEHSRPATDHQPPARHAPPARDEGGGVVTRATDGIFRAAWIPALLLTPSVPVLVLVAVVLTGGALSLWPLMRAFPSLYQGRAVLIGVGYLVALGTAAVLVVPAVLAALLTGVAWAGVLWAWVARWAAAQVTS